MKLTVLKLGNFLKTLLDELACANLHKEAEINSILDQINYRMTWLKSWYRAGSFDPFFFFKDKKGHFSNDIITQ